MELFKLLGTIAIDSGDSESKLNNITEKASTTSQKIGSAFSNIGTKAEAVSKAFAPVTLAIGAAGVAFTGLATKSAESMDNIDKMSQRLGISREAFQELDFALSQSGVDINSFQTGAKSLLANMDKVAAGNKDATNNFNMLGVSVQNADGSFRSQEEVLWDTISAFQNMEDSAEKSRLAQELFGKQGQEIIPLLNSEAGSIEAMRQQAHELGLVMSDEAVDAGVEFTDTLDQFKRSASAAAATAGANLLPTLTNLLKLLIEKGVPAFQKVAEKIGEVVTWFSNLGEGGKKTVLIIVGLVAAISPVAGIISAISTVMGVLIPAVSGCAAAFGALNISIFPIIAVIAAVVAIGVALYKNWDTIKEKAGQLGEWMSEKWNAIKEKTSQAWNNVKETVSNAMSKAKQKIEEHGGGIKGFIGAMGENIKERWSNAFNAMDKVTGGKLSDMKSKIEEHGGGIKGFFGTMGESIKQRWSDAFDAMDKKSGGKLGDMLSTVKDKFSKVKDSITEKLTAAKDKVSEMIEKIKGFFKFDWSFPKLKLPHFKISGSFSLNPPSVPSFGIDWYKKAMDDPMIMNTPTAFGLNKNGQIMAGGEAGSEVVSGTDTLMNMISDAVAAKNERLESILDSILGYMPQLANMQLVTDTGALVGAIAPQMDRELGKRAARSGRGV